jgi:hypothetical protein
MKKNTILAIIAISLLASTGIQFLRHEANVGLILGGALAFIFGPYIFASIIKYKNKLFSWVFTDKSFLFTYLVIWFILIVLNIASK